MAEKADVTIYFAQGVNGIKIPILLESLEIPYKIQYVNIDKGEQFAPEYLKISPNNKIPAIVDSSPPDGNGPLSIFESAAILQYLAYNKAKQLGKSTHLYPADDVRVKALTDQWLYFQSASLGPMSGQWFHFLGLPQPNDAAAKRFEVEVHRNYAVMERHLNEVKFFNGHDFSIADIAIYPWVSGFLSRVPGIKKKYPAIAQWLAQVGDQKGVKEGLRKGDEAAAAAAGAKM
ncbi:glutathione S-transferase [Cladochytrium replicatum]|nr:glutathione S-transferase [Cladochytrium replicatum]